MVNKLRNLGLALVAMVALGGCSAVESRIVNVVSKDLDVSIKRGEAILGPQDPLVVCYKALDQVIKAHQAADSMDNGYLLDAVMRARIIDQVRQRVGKQLEAACSQIAFEVMLQAAQRR